DESLSCALRASVYRPSERVPRTVRRDARSSAHWCETVAVDAQRLMTDAERLERELRPKVRAAMPAVLADLERLARIPSVSAAGFDPQRVRESAAVTAEILRDAGAEVRIVERP